jgi:hypothetical protein
MAIRKHWFIENNNIVLKIAMTLLANDNTKKIIKRGKRLRAALDTKYKYKLFKL